MHAAKVASRGHFVKHARGPAKHVSLRLLGGATDGGHTIGQRGVGQRSIEGCERQDLVEGQFNGRGIVDP